MISMQDATLRRAQDFARDRGWRCEPLGWEEVQLLAELAADGIDPGCCDCAGDGPEYAAGYEDGYTDGWSLAIDREAVQEWCADNGYTIVKVVAS